jgi:hypothetical protein
LVAGRRTALQFYGRCGNPDPDPLDKRWEKQQRERQAEEEERLLRELEEAREEYEAFEKRFGVDGL